MHSLGRIQLAFALFYFVLQGQTSLLLQVSLDFLFFVFQSPMINKISFLVLVLRGLLGLHRTDQLHLLGIAGRGIDLDYCDVEWLALKMNRDHSVIFEVAHEYCTLDSFVDNEGYSISSMVFLPTVVDIMVI